MTDPYQQQLGERLRAIRSMQGMTLAEVEERSDGEWKAVVVGSYERGDRAVSVARLSELAAFYGVPVGHLLPENRGGSGDRLTLDLAALEERGDDLETLTRFVQRIQQERGDYNGRVLTLRLDDLRTVATATGSTVEDLLADLLSREIVSRG
jgi:transcriptional regulator with XRE-family HTH domain